MRFRKESVAAKEEVVDDETTTTSIFECPMLDNAQRRSPFVNRLRWRRRTFARKLAKLPRRVYEKIKGIDSGCFYDRKSSTASTPESRALMQASFIERVDRQHQNCRGALETIGPYLSPLNANIENQASSTPNARGRRLIREAASPRRGVNSGRTTMPLLEPSAYERSYRPGPLSQRRRSEGTNGSTSSSSSQSRDRIAPNSPTALLDGFTQPDVVVEASENRQARLEARLQRLETRRNTLRNGSINSIPPSTQPSARTPVRSSPSQAGANTADDTRKRTIRFVSPERTASPPSLARAESWSSNSSVDSNIIPKSTHVSPSSSAANSSIDLAGSETSIAVRPGTPRAKIPGYTPRTGGIMFAVNHNPANSDEALLLYPSCESDSGSSSKRHARFVARVGARLRARFRAPDAPNLEGTSTQAVPIETPPAERPSLMTLLHEEAPAGSESWPEKVNRLEVKPLETPRAERYNRLPDAPMQSQEFMDYMDEGMWARRTSTLSLV